jgi:hypothetical protein
VTRAVLYDIGGRKNPQHFDAIASGWGAERVRADRAEPVWGALHLVCGLQFGALGILKQIIAKRERYVFFDRAYTQDGKDWLRVVPNAYQHNFSPASPVDRWEQQGLELAPWTRQGEEVMVVPPSAAVVELFGLGDWLGETLHRLAQATTRRVFVSEKGDPVPLPERLARAWAVVTCTSTVACKAAVAGVPVMVDYRSAAFGVSTWDLAWPMRVDRRPWAHALAYGQYTLSEIAGGLAREYADRMGRRVQRV